MCSLGAKEVAAVDSCFALVRELSCVFNDNDNNNNNNNNNNNSNDSNNDF